MRLIGSPSPDDEVFMNFAPGAAQQNDTSPPTATEGEYEDPLDDVFGSAPASPVLQSDTLRSATGQADPSDIPRLRSVHVTNGYREGIAASKEQHVQAGFDEGYGLGAELGMMVGWILGVLEGLDRAAGKEDGEEVKEQAEEELSVVKLFGEEFFGGDGVWVYPVPEEGKEEVSFARVAAAHPFVVKWTARVKELARAKGLEVE